MRRRGRAFAVMAVLLLFAGVGAVSLAGAESIRPPVFDVAVEAAPVVVSASVPSALPLAVDTGVARSSVAINSQPNAVSQAAIVYLPLLEAAPALFGLPALPAQALPYCYSYFPGDPREAACGGPAQNAGAFDVAGGSGRTKTGGEAADPTTLRSESSVAAAQVRSTASLPLPVAIGTVASAARAGADDRGRMAAGASTAISDLDVAGVLHIGSLRSEVTGALGGTAGSAAHQESVTLSGAAVAGQPVTVDNDGVHAAGQTLGRELIDAQKQVDDALQAAGVQIRTIPAAPPKIADDGTAAELTSGGVVVSLAPQGQGRVELRLGVSRLTMSAYRDAVAAAGGADAAGLGGELLAGDGGDGVEPAGGTAVEPVGSTSSNELALPPPAAPAPGDGSGPPSATPFQRQVLARELAASSWRVPFGPFALLVLAGPLLVQARRLSLTRR